MQQILLSRNGFEHFRNKNGLYVDKTRYLLKLLESDDGIFFLSRPRRFGKSLTLSTLEAIFQGKQDLFKGLAIYEKYDWGHTYPLIHLDLGNCRNDTPEILEGALTDKLVEIALKNNLKLGDGDYSSQFEDLINDLSAKSPVVILVDEYDSPIIDNIGKKHVEDIIYILKKFYTVLKTCNNALRFVFITGVSKFSHVSLFSDLSNLKDISMDPEFATMLGYTQKELEENFAEYIDEVCITKGMERTQLLAQISERYGGYRFCEDAERVYNPISTAYFFSDQEHEFKNYWYSTATPSFLVKYAKTKNLALAQDLRKPLKASKLDPAGFDDIGVPAIMFQTGYLTIKDSFIKDKKTYYNLDFPNYEVKHAFENYLVNKFIH